MKIQEEIEQLGKDYAKDINNINGTACFDFIVGYCKCREDMADKKYTLEDIKKAFHCGRLYLGREGDTTLEQFINSLNKQD